MSFRACLALCVLLLGVHRCLEGQSIGVDVHIDTLRRIETGPFSKGRLDRNIYFRCYHSPGMYSEERSTELIELGVVPGRGTNGLSLEPGQDGKAFSSELRVKALQTYVDKYRRAKERYPGIVHALANNRYPQWMRASTDDDTKGGLLEDWEKLARADVLRKELYEPLAIFYRDWFSNLKREHVSLPSYYSVKNEPAWAWDYSDFATFTDRVSKVVQSEHPEIRITGPCSAWPYPGPTFDKWHEREKKFIDGAGGSVGGYDLHFYSKGYWSLPPEPKWQRQRVSSPSLHESQRMGISTVWEFGRSDAYLDLWNAYHLSRWGGELKPMIISEFGRQTIHPQFGPWLNDFKPWLFMNTIVRQWMNFMDRPEVRLTVPFILAESDKGYAPRRGQTLYTRYEAPDSLELTRTRFVDFFSFFRDLKGERVKHEMTTGADDARWKVWVQAFRDGNRLYILLHNGGGYPASPVAIDLNILKDGGPTGLVKIEQKRIHFEGSVPSPEAEGEIDGTLHISKWDGYESVADPLLLLDGEETRILRVLLKEGTAEPEHQRIESRVYSTDTLVPFRVGRLAEISLELTESELDSVTLANLVVSLARDDGFDQTAHVAVNGKKVGEIDLTFSRGIAAFHAPVEIPIPVDSLQGGTNSVKVAFRDRVRGGNPTLVSARVDLVREN